MSVTPESSNQSDILTTFRVLSFIYFNVTAGSNVTICSDLTFPLKVHYATLLQARHKALDARNSL